MKKVHLISVPFTGLGLHNGFRGNKWLKQRISIFARFVLPSILNQSSQDFVLWLAWRPEERTNPIVKQFKANLDQIRDLKVVFTYGGCFFYDDKYPPYEAKDRLLKNLQLTLPDLAEVVGDADFVYQTIQPSDDMYLSTAFEVIQGTEPKEKLALGFKEGYIMNYATKEIAEYNPTTNPPFYTIIFPRDIFLNPFDHMRYIGPYMSHEYIPNKLEYLTIEGRGYVVGTHGDNISTTWNIPFKGRLLTKEEQEAVLIKTGTLFSEPIIPRKNLKLSLRRIFNLLPFQDRLRNLYHSLPTKYKIL